MKARLLHTLETLFSIYAREWPKALVLLTVATLLGMGFSLSRAASEGLFLSRLGIQYLPMLLLVNPVLVLLASAVYSVFADRIPNERLLVYTALLPVPLILLMYLLSMLEANWVYFLLYAFVLAHAAILTTSWVVYLAGHYDVQEAKRLLPFISSGILIGTVAGGLGTALCAPLIGARNLLLVWIALSLGVAEVVWWMARRFTALETASRKVTRGARQPGMLQNLKEGLAYSRTSSLFMTTTVVSIATMVAIQLIDFEYSKLFAQRYTSPAALTAFLGIFDGLTNVAALLLQWFVAPWCIRRFGVQKTNLLFPYILTASFGMLLLAPTFSSAMWARFTRMSLMQSLRGTTRSLMLNAVPRKMGARVRSFNTGIVLPAGQGLGALTLVLLKGVEIPLLFPLLGFLVAVFFVWYSYRQNTAYGEALLNLLREDKIHLLDLDDNEIRQLDATAVAAISARLGANPTRALPAAAPCPAEQDAFRDEMARSQEEVSLAAIELLQAIGSQPAFVALQQHLPFASPRLTAAALQAITAIGGTQAATILPPYLYNSHPQVRLAAIAGLRRLDAPTLQQHLATLLDDSDVQVRAATLAVVLNNPAAADYGRAYQSWESMLMAAEEDLQVAALAIMGAIPPTPLQGRLYHALQQPERRVRHTALRVLQQLAAHGRIQEVDAALLRSLHDDDPDTRELAVQVLAAMGTDSALESLFTLLDDEQPRVRETLIQALKAFGKRAITPLLERLQSPRAALRGKETALLALTRLEGMQEDQLRPFWEGILRDVYQYRLMLVCLESQQALEADTFLRVALRNAYEQLLALLFQLFAVWTSPQAARLVENGLHDPDRHIRAQALEALESLSERHFTRLFLPLLAASEEHASTWREIAQHQWQLTYPDVPTVLDACRQSPDKWLVIGSLLSAQARAAVLGNPRTQLLQQLAASADDPDIRNTARYLLDDAAMASPHRLSLPEVMLFLKRIPLYSSLSLDQLHTISLHLTERDAQPGEVIFPEDEESYELYLIVSGKVNIVKKLRGIEQTLATLTAGEFFGDMAIFENLPRSASVVSVDHSVLLLLRPEHFRQIVLQEPAISFEIFRALSARIRHLDDREVVTSTH